MSEQEMYRGLHFNVENPLSIDQRINLVDQNREVVICHNIFAVDSGPMLSLFANEGQDSSVTDDLKRYQMFNCVIGYPYPASVSNVPDDFKDSEERFKLQHYAEREFSEEYFNTTKGVCGYVRYIHDFAYDDWNRRNIDRLVDELNSEGVSVSKILEGNTSEHIFHAILLFERC